MAGAPRGEFVRIAVDMHVLEGKFQGSRRYLEGLYRSILATPSEHEWVFLLGDRANAPSGWPAGAAWQAYGTQSRLGRLLWAGPSAVRGAGADAYHVQYVGPLLKSCGREIVTVHDLLFESHPQFFSATARLSLATLVRRTVQRAALVLTVSEFTRGELKARYGVSDDKLVLTPNGIDLERFSPGERKASQSIIGLRYGVHDYLLTVGRIEPRKNHSAILRAYSVLRARGRDLPCVVFAGARDAAYPQVRQQVAELGLEDRVLFLHDLGDEMLPHLYRAALATVYPSFAEGFGIPPLEAMACGCPVICSETTALREVLGTAGVRVDPSRADSLVEALSKAVCGQIRSDDRIEAGIAQARRYSWAASASAYLDGLSRLRA